jgi:hypothetical protein
MDRFSRFCFVLTRVAARVAMALRRSPPRGTDILVPVTRGTDLTVSQDFNICTEVNAHFHGYIYSRDDYPALAGIAAVRAELRSSGAATESSVPTPMSSTRVIGNLTYVQSGSTWYQPESTGTSTSYVAVTPLR